MGKALIALGYDVLGCRLDFSERLMQDDLKPALNEAGKYEALQDVPWAALYKELDQTYPGSKFVLTVRDDDKWLNSASKHFKNTDFKLHEWLYGNGILIGNEELYIKRYRKHYKEVKEYFKDRKDLLIMDFAKGDGWNKLCAFLDKPIPNEPFPHANKGKHNYNKKDKFIWFLKNTTPMFIRKTIFETRLFFLKRMGYKDPRNRFNNFKENRKVLLMMKKAHLK